MTNQQKKSQKKNNQSGCVFPFLSSPRFFRKQKNTQNHAQDVL